MRHFLLATIMLIAGCGAAQAQNACPPTGLESVEATHTRPPYPVESQRRGETGATEMFVTINTEGVVTATEMVRSSGSAVLDQAAAAHVQQVWRWRPATQNCKPVEAKTAVRVVWSLQEPLRPQEAGAILNPPLADYPPEAQALDRQVTVGVSCTVSEEGVLLATRIFRSSGNAALDAKTQEFVRSRYSWTAAQISGRPVRSEINLVVRWFPERAR